MNNLKDKLTNVIAVVLVVAQIVQLVGQAVSGYLKSVNDINWMQLVLVVGAALVAYFTGKNSDGSKPV